MFAQILQVKRTLKLEVVKSANEYRFQYAMSMMEWAKSKINISTEFISVYSIYVISSYVENIFENKGNYNIK